MPIICNAMENTSLDDFVAGVRHSIQSGESVHSWLSSLFGNDSFALSVIKTESLVIYRLSF